MISNSSICLHSFIVFTVCHTADASRVEQSRISCLWITGTSMRHRRTSNHKIEQFCHILLWYALWYTCRGHHLALGIHIQSQSNSHPTTLLWHNTVRNDFSQLFHLEVKLTAGEKITITSISQYYCDVAIVVRFLVARKNFTWTI
jgi:hypothetical protein